MAHPFGLTDEEHEALAMLQEGTSIRDPAEAVWINPLLLNLVWIDPSSDPPAILLTSSGWRYPCD